MGLRRLVLASGNPGKLREIRALLEPLLIDVVAQSELGVGEAEEPHETFLENALAKARHASRVTGLPALADDSGLLVTALGGAPGVHSAVYAGHEGTREQRDARNNMKLLTEMARFDDRRAHYCCVMVLMRRAGDPQPMVAEGLWRGEITRSPRGASGFGYDPLFVPSGGAVTAAELGATEKNRVSHRARAMARLLNQLREEC